MIAREAMVKQDFGAGDRKERESKDTPGLVQDMTSAEKLPLGPLTALGACVSGGDC